MTLSEVYRLFLYLNGVRENEIEIAEKNPYSQVTIKILSFREYIQMTREPERRI
jgi:hypothetical protein